jgi:hypothetical protein
VEARADLATAFRILTGTTIRGAHGERAFPIGSTVEVEVLPAGSRIAQLRLDGSDVEKSLVDAGISASGQLAAIRAFAVTIEYPDSTTRRSP